MKNLSVNFIFVKLLKQFRFELKKIRNECPLYCHGERIDRAINSPERKIDELFNKILEGQGQNN